MNRSRGGGSTVDATTITSVDPTEYLFWTEVRRTAEGQADRVTDETGKLLGGFPLREHDLAGLIRTAAATNLTEAQALDAIAKGIDAGYIMEVTGRHFLDTDAEESGSLPGGITTGTTLYGIISPRQAPGRILDDPTDFGVAYWRKVWDDRDFDPTERKPKNILKAGSHDDPVTAKERQEAILGAGEHLDALKRIVEDGDLYYRLKFDGYPTPLNDIWERSNKEINNPLPKEHIANLTFNYYVEVKSDDFDITDARTKVQDWITAGKLIDASDEAGASDHYRMVEPDELEENDVVVGTSDGTPRARENQSQASSGGDNDADEMDTSTTTGQEEPNEMGKGAPDGPSMSEFDDNLGAPEEDDGSTDHGSTINNPEGIESSGGSDPNKSVEKSQPAGGGADQPEASQSPANDQEEAVEEGQPEESQSPPKESENRPEEDEQEDWAGVEALEEDTEEDENQDSGGLSPF